jgi:hypothetical protein
MFVFLEDIPFQTRLNTWLRHDGALPHVGDITGNLNPCNGNSLIGRGGLQGWPSLTDLTPHDFYLCGWMMESCTRRTSRHEMNSSSISWTVLILYETPRKPTECQNVLLVESMKSIQIHYRGARRCCCRRPNSKDWHEECIDMEHTLTVCYINWTVTEISVLHELGRVLHNTIFTLVLSDVLSGR